jgi:hypothetical protein
LSSKENQTRNRPRAQTNVQQTNAQKNVFDDFGTQSQTKQRNNDFSDFSNFDNFGTKSQPRSSNTNANANTNKGNNNFGFDDFNNFNKPQPAPAKTQEIQKPPQNTQQNNNIGSL